MRVRPLDPARDDEIALVADRMRATLVEVLGEPRGTAMYTLEWLRARVRWHLDPAREAAVLLAEGDDGGIVGHTMVRVEAEEGPAVGLHATTYVVPAARRGGVASTLLDAGEDWMRARAMRAAATYTSPTNTALIELYTRHGYAITAREGEFVRLGRAL